MRFLQSVVLGAETRASMSGLASPAGWLIDALAGPVSSLTGERVTVRKSLGLAPVWSAVTMIAETVGSLPLKVYRDLDEDSRVEARAHRAWRMLHDKPNPLTTAHRFWSTAVAHYLLWGNIFIEKIRGDGGLVEELWLLDPAEMTVEWDANLRTRRFYRDIPGQGRKYWSEDEVLHILGFSIDGLLGMSPIAQLRDPLGAALARDRFEGGFYARGGTLPGTLTHPSELSHDAQKRLKADFKAVLKSGEWAVLEEGMTANQLSMPLADMEFVASKQMSRTDIALIFHLPPAYLGGSTGDSLTYSNVEQNKIQFADFAIAPPTSAIAKSLAADPGIFPQQVFFPEFELKALARADMKTRAAFYKDLAAVNAIQVNEIRGLENMEPVDGGDNLEKALAQEANPPPPPGLPGVPLAPTNGQAPNGAFSLPSSNGSN
jgi:HK97 family phage portal protein